MWTWDQYAAGSFILLRDTDSPSQGPRPARRPPVDVVEKVNDAAVQHDHSGIEHQDQVLFAVSESQEIVTGYPEREPP